MPRPAASTPAAPSAMAACSARRAGAPETAHVVQQLLRARSSALSATFLCQEHADQLLDGALQVVVDEHVVEEAVVRDLVLGRLKAPLHGRLVFAGAASQPALERRHV